MFDNKWQINAPNGLSIKALDSLSSVFHVNREVLLKNILTAIV